MNKIFKQGLKGIKVFIFILFSFFFFALLLCSCSTQRITTTDYVHDTLYVSQVLHDSIVKETIRHDTLIQIKTVEVETTIRQDSAGNELSRNTNRTVNNDTYHGCGVTDKDYQLMLKQDSIKSSQNKDKQVEKVQEQTSPSWLAKLWQKLKTFAWIVCGCVIGFVIGRFWSRIKQVLHLK